MGMFIIAPFGSGLLESFAVCLILWDLWFLGLKESIGIFLFSLLFLFPQYLALIRYGLKSNSIWNKISNQSLELNGG
jgi:hypothetical protein